MPGADEIRFVIVQWMRKAENDWTNANHTLKLGERCPTDTVCFHAQQCVEKYLKALLLDRRGEIPRTHSIKTLLALLPESCRPELTAEEQEFLSDFAVFTRYPGDYEEISLREAKRALRLARRVRSFIRKAIPGIKNRKNR